MSHQPPVTPSETPPVPPPANPPAGRPARAGWPLASLAFLCVMGLAALLRLPHLDERPMHADEAVQAYIFADLLEHGKYRYDPAHYHGPLPHFINLPLMRALGVQKLDALRQWQFRLQPALAGLLVVLLAAACAGAGGVPRRAGAGIFGVRRFIAAFDGAIHRPAPSAATQPDTFAPCGGQMFRVQSATVCHLPVESGDKLPHSKKDISPAGAAAAALLAASSPLLVYFSRMAIHETLLACLALAVPLTAARFLKNRSTGWLLAAGVALGGLHATKETWSVIAFSWAAAAVALNPRKTWRLLRETGAARLALAAAVALAVSFLLHSNFGRHPRGFADAWLTLFQYRTGGGHDKPWSYYLTDILTFRPAGAGCGWHGEGVILLFAALGAISRMRNADWGLRNKRRSRAGCEQERWSPHFASHIPHPASQNPHSELPVFLALSAVVQVAVYSMIGYKTPWLMLVPVAGLVPLAGHGFAWLARGGAAGASDDPAPAAVHAPAPPAAACRAIAGGAAVLALVLLGNTPQLRALAGAAGATNPALPVVYAPTLPGADAALRNAVASLKPGELAAVIGDDYWPVPWYFRARRDDTGYYEEFEAPGDLSPFALVVRCGYAPPAAARPDDVLVELRPGYHARISRR
jgi:predicted membrane-bound mannosyltransferase